MKKLKITFNSPVVLGFIFISLAALSARLWATGSTRNNQAVGVNI